MGRTQKGADGAEEEATMSENESEITRREEALAHAGEVVPGSGVRGKPRRMARMMSVRLDGRLIGQLREVAQRSTEDRPPAALQRLSHIRPRPLRPRRGIDASRPRSNAAASLIHLNTLRHQGRLTPLLWTWSVGPPPCRILHPNFRELRVCELRRIRLMRSSQNPQKAKFAEYLFHALG